MIKAGIRYGGMGNDFYFSFNIFVLYPQISILKMYYVEKVKSEMIFCTLAKNVTQASSAENKNNFA